MSAALNIAFFGSSLVSAYWNGAATYYRGIIRALHARGHRVTFYEPDAYDRQAHRDMPAPAWARVVVYSAQSEDAALRALADAGSADVLIKASGVGVFDELLEAAVPDAVASHGLAVYWDVDAPATLARLHGDPADPLRRRIRDYDAVLTYGGGRAVTEAYARLGARQCAPIYNALDPHSHHPAAADARFECDLGFLGNRLPDRERRVEDFLLAPASARPDRRFLLGGSGWDDKVLPPNVGRLGHVYTHEHNAFNCTALAVLNVSRDSMAHTGYSPATRVFEAAGAGACLISDAWEGIACFLEPDREILVAASGAAVGEHLDALTPRRARSIGAAARRRVLAEHTYAHRADAVERALTGTSTLPSGATP